MYLADQIYNDELIRVNNVIKLTTNFNKPERSESLTGGAGTVNKIGKNAFSHHFTTLSFEDRQNFLIGNGFLENYGLLHHHQQFPLMDLVLFTMLERVNYVI